MAKRKRRSAGASKRDVYQEITDQVVAALEEGTVPWRKPWTELGLQRNLQSGRNYRGLNQLLLQMAQMKLGYSSPLWSTYRAAAKAGGQVRKGESSTLVTFWRRLNVDDPDNPGEKKTIPFVRFYPVFNLTQIDGLEAAAIELREFDPIERCEEILNGYVGRPKVIHSGDRACYSPLADLELIPPPQQFASAEGYYATRFHEDVHSSGHASRLDRFPAGGGDDLDYGNEELVAELGAAFLCAEARISPATLTNAAAYIDHWLGQVQGDKRLIVTASGLAQRAVDHILGVSFEENDDDSEAQNSAAPAPAGGGA